MSDETQNFVLGAGKLYFDAFDANGNVTGERYLGDTPGFEVTIETENLEKWGSDSAIAEKLKDVTTQVTRNTTIQCDNISDDNLELFVIGDLQTVSSSAASVEDESLGTVLASRYYQLGVSASVPTGVRDIENVVVHDGSTAATAYTLGTDYTVDLTLGRIHVLPDGALAGNAAFVDYDTTAGSRTQVLSSDTAPQSGALRFIADNTEGDNRDLYAPNVQLRPNGAMAFKSRDTWQQMQFVAELLVSGQKSAVYIDGRQVASS